MKKGITEKANQTIVANSEEFVSKVLEMKSVEGYMARFLRETPYNPFTRIAGSKEAGHAYKGFNAFILAMTASNLGLSMPYFATFNQLKKEGGTVKGLTGTPVLSPIIFPKKDENGKVVLNDKGEKEMVFTGKYRVGYVFPLEKAEGIDISKYSRKLNESPYVFEDVERLVESYGITVKNDPQAHYNPIDHEIGMPLPEKYRTNEAYASSLFHELTHSTGKELGRNLEGGQHSVEYAYEELVAEFGSMLLSETFGLKYEPSNSAKYMRSWLELIQEEKQEAKLVEAYADAGKAVKYLLSFLEEAKEEVA